MWFFVFSISLGTLGPFFLSSFFILCACVYSEHGTAGEPGAVAGVSQFWPVEGGLRGAQSPLSCLGVACASRHEGWRNGLCLATICNFLSNVYEIDLSSGSLFSPFLLALSVVSSLFIIWFRVRACTPSTAPRKGSTP